MRPRRWPSGINGSTVRHHGHLIVFTLVSVLLSSCANNEPYFSKPHLDNRIQGTGSLSAPADANDAERELPCEEPAILELTLEESVDIALKNSYQILIAGEEIEKAYGKISEAKSAAMPNITGNLAYTRMDATPQISFGSLSLEMGDENIFTGELGLKQPLYMGGKIISSIRAAEANSVLTEEQSRGVRQLIVFQAKKSYFDVLLAEENCEVAKNYAELAEAHVNDVEKLYDQEVASEYDLLRARVQVANAEAFLVKAENFLHLSKTSFLKVLGLPQDRKVRLTDKLVYEPVEPSFEQALTTALELRTELIQSDIAVGIQKENINIVAADLYPSIFAFGNYGVERPTRKLPTEAEWDDYWNLGVGASIPVFEGWRTQSKLRQEDSVLRQMWLAQSDVKDTIRLEVRQAILSLEDARRFVESQKENVRQAEEALRLAGVGYKNGVNTQLEVLDAQTALTEARKNYIQALYSHMVAGLMLEKATGAIGEPRR